ncbi:hypothetical protein RUND412_005410 [Rhizina undulata]
MDLDVEVLQLQVHSLVQKMRKVESSQRLFQNSTAATVSAAAHRKVYLAFEDSLELQSILRNPSVTSAGQGPKRHSIASGEIFEELDDSGGSGSGHRK